MDDTVGELISNFQNYVVSPLNAFGIGGFLFSVEGDTLAQLTSEITDHYIESNEAVQDHIAIRPDRITLKGYIGELVYQGASTDTGFLESAVQKLTTLGSYLPELSKAATQLVDAVQTPSASDITLADASNIFGMVNNLIGAFGDQAVQARGYAYFKALQKGKILMGVQTPWEFMTNMAIEAVVPIQNEETRSVTEFSITLKQIRTAQTLTTAFGTSSAPQAANPNGSPAVQYQGVAAPQASNPVTIGDVPGLTLPTSAISGSLSQVTGVRSLWAGPNPTAANIFKYDGGG